ncbi:MAG: hypothetical protein KatS3mg063_2670 [Tepidiforma sp.]|uniref:hypothetical protein n=1 Tax=Tepidiforma sp. TaxID=2682230 RepID=UPI0017FFCD9A|nr:hypothetical protein [Tepidiforma sp.]GIW16817.1 MAG: hypothetical protein KatS3mg063_2670 [Tepidiforma sp.]
MDLDQLERRLEAATGAPWEQHRTWLWTDAAPVAVEVVGDTAWVGSNPWDDRGPTIPPMRATTEADVIALVCRWW